MVSENTGSEVMPHWVLPFGLRSPGSLEPSPMIIRFVSPFPDKLYKHENQTPAWEDTESHTFWTLKSNKLIFIPPPPLKQHLRPPGSLPQPQVGGGILRVWSGHSVDSITADCPPLGSHLSVFVPTDSLAPPFLAHRTLVGIQKRGEVWSPHCMSLLHKRPAGNPS